MQRHEEEIINYVRQTYGITPTTIHQRQGSIRLIVPNEPHIFFALNPPNPAACVAATIQKIQAAWGGTETENQMANHQKHIREVITWVQSEYGFTPKTEPDGGGHMKIILSHGARTVPPVTMAQSPTNVDNTIKNTKRDIVNILGAPTPPEPTQKRTLADMMADLKPSTPEPLPAPPPPAAVPPPKKPDPATVGKVALYLNAKGEYRFTFIFPPEFAKKLQSKTFSCTETTNDSWELKPSIIGGGIHKTGALMAINADGKNTKHKPFGVTPADFVYSEGILLVSLKESPRSIDERKSGAARMAKPRAKAYHEAVWAPPPAPVQQRPVAPEPAQSAPQAKSPSTASLTARGKAILDQMREFEAATGYMFTKIRADDGTYKWILRAPTIE